MNIFEEKELKYRMSYFIREIFIFKFLYYFLRIVREKEYLLN